MHIEISINNTAFAYSQKAKEEDEKWKWWEEEKNHSDGRKWTTLEHHGPYFPPPYEPLPSSIKFKYEGEKQEVLFK